MKGFFVHLARAFRPTLADVNWVCAWIAVGIVTNGYEGMTIWRFVACVLLMLCGTVAAVEHGYRKRVKFEEDTTRMFDKLDAKRSS